MSTFSMVGNLKLLPAWKDGTITDSTRITVSANVADGTGDGQADVYWRDVLTIASEAEAFVDLTDLSMAFYGATGSVSLALVKQLLIVNKTATSTLYLWYGTTNQWSALASGESVIGPMGSWWVNNPNAGYAVTESSKVIPIGNDGPTDATVEVYVVGVRA
mgnify:CR=1 FL=1